MILRRLRFYANLIYVHACVRYRHLSRTSPYAWWLTLVGVGDDVMYLLLNGRLN